MYNLSLCKTTNNNHYLVTSEDHYHIFLTPLCLYFIENDFSEDLLKLPKTLTIENNVYNSEEINYYYKKYLFLKQYGLLKKREIPTSQQVSGNLREEDLTRILANLTNLVFEVTDACNLKCKYCGYGEFYNDYDVRNNQNMSFQTAKSIIDYLVPFWESPYNHTLNRNITFGFYGGEPLMNIDLIKNIVVYVERVLPSTINCTFNMTTNGTLLHQSIDYLVSKNFRIIISLDGNEVNHCYRVTHSGANSYSLVYDNILLVRKKYPVFFETNVNFNAVLHNKNSVGEIYAFIKSEFEKNPYIFSLSTQGINKRKLAEFKLLFKNLKEDIAKSENHDQLIEKIGIISPDFREAASYVNHFTGNIYSKYSDLFLMKKANLIPTGTCLPFEKKMFVTVTGKILPCERIGQNNYLGRVANHSVDLDLKDIASKYNRYYKMLEDQCGNCYSYLMCTHCIYSLFNSRKKIHCPQIKSAKYYDLSISKILSFFEQNPIVYKECLDITFD